jgi:hypothetical protein
MTLLAELQSGPLSTEIAPHITSGNDGAIAELLNAPYSTVTGSISRSLFAIWVAETGMRGVIRDHALNPSSPLRSIAISIEDFLGGAAETLDFSKAQNVAMLAAWVAAGGCTQEQADDLISRCQVPVSRAEQIMGRAVTDLDVRRVIWNDDGTRAI